MSGVYNRGMQMHSDCAICGYENYGRCFARGVLRLMDVSEYIVLQKQSPDCPLFAVPDHGHLIDADALREAVGKVEEESRREYHALSEAEKECEYEQGVWDGVHMVAKMISVAPTIIPADKEAVG